MRLLLSLGFVLLLIYSRKKALSSVSNNTRLYDILIFCVYLVVVLILTIGIRSNNNDAVIFLNPIKEYKDVLDTLLDGIKKDEFYMHFQWVQAALEGYVLNILLFVPFGFLIPYVMKECNTCWIVILIGFAFSLFIELIQLITHLGWFDATDIIHNTIGSFIGYKIFTIIERR